MQTLTDRQLNRATLARQMLLERSDRAIPDAVQFLGGLQAQQSNDPYIALWSRLRNFRQEDLTGLIVGRTLARATTMRGTLHLHTIDDLYGIRVLAADFLKGVWRTNFLRRFGSEKPAMVIRAGVKHLDAHGPMTAGALGKALHEKFPTAEPLALSALLQLNETLIQVPPTRLWGKGGAPLLTRARNWLPPPGDLLTRRELVRRYLRAFGPASVGDMRTWCRLTRLGAEFEALRPELATFRSENGRVLYDLPDAPRPDPETPAPVRFLPLYDNAYLGYEDRGRMLPPADKARSSMFLSFRPAVLVDGVIAAGWSVQSAKGRVLLRVEPYRKLARAERRELEREGLGLARFVDPHATGHSVEIAAPAA